MKKLLATICAGAVLGLMASCDDAPGKAKAYNQGINIIPTPVSLTQNEGNFKLNKNTKIYASTPEAKTVAEFFAAKMNTATGYQIATADKETSDGISLVIDGSLDVNDEGYTLDVAAFVSKPRPLKVFSTVCNRSCNCCPPRSRVLPP